MIKKELAEEIKKELGVTGIYAARVVDITIETIKKRLEAGEEVSFIGFGKFQVKERKGRTGCNPRTGNKIQIPPKKMVS